MTHNPTISNKPDFSFGLYFHSQQAANLIFELWTTPTGERFVRIFQNGNLMKTTTNWCNLEWCAMSQFTANMEKYIPRDVLEECGTE